MFSKCSSESEIESSSSSVVTTRSATLQHKKRRATGNVSGSGGGDGDVDADSNNDITDIITESHLKVVDSCASTLTVTDSDSVAQSESEIKKHKKMKVTANMNEASNSNQNATERANEHCIELSTMATVSLASSSSALPSLSLSSSFSSCSSSPSFQCSYPSQSLPCSSVSIPLATDLLCLSVLADEAREYALHLLYGTRVLQFFGKGGDVIRFALEHFERSRTIYKTCLTESLSSATKLVDCICTLLRDWSPDMALYSQTNHQITSWTIPLRLELHWMKMESILRDTMHKMIEFHESKMDQHAAVSSRAAQRRGQLVQQFKLYLQSPPPQNSVTVTEATKTKHKANGKDASNSDDSHCNDGEEEEEEEAKQGEGPVTLALKPLCKALKTYISSLGQEDFLPENLLYSVLHCLQSLRDGDDFECYDLHRGFDASNNNTFCEDGSHVVNSNLKALVQRYRHMNAQQVQQLISPFLQQQQPLPSGHSGENNETDKVNENMKNVETLLKQAKRTKTKSSSALQLVSDSSKVSVYSQPQTGESLPLDLSFTIFEYCRSPRFRIIYHYVEYGCGTFYEFRSVIFHNALHLRQSAEAYWQVLLKLLVNLDDNYSYVVDSDEEDENEDEDEKHLEDQEEQIQDGKLNEKERVKEMEKKKLKKLKAKIEKEQRAMSAINVAALTLPSLLRKILRRCETLEYGCFDDGYNRPAKLHWPFEDDAFSGDESGLPIWRGVLCYEEREGDKHSPSDCRYDTYPPLVVLKEEQVKDCAWIKLMMNLKSDDETEEMEMDDSENMVSGEQLE